jgi:Zn-dependent protease
MDVGRILYSLPGVIVGLTVHEYCHAWAAYKLGDTTAKDQGRLTFNPLRHLDILGFVFILFAGFGWAKPVQFNPENLAHPRRDNALIAAAGPVSNLLLALALLVSLRGLQAGIGWLFAAAPESAASVFVTAHAQSVNQVFAFLMTTAAVNLGLFVFNLIPLPPLDGSHIVFSGMNLSPETAQSFMKVGTYVLFGILYFENRSDVDILPIGKAVRAIIGFFFPA